MPGRPDFDPGAAIGVFDSGIGGLSVLRALREALPNEHFVYVADSAWTPYGERRDEIVLERTEAITRHLREAHAVKALVIACNTASAVAVERLREDHPDWPIVAIEPALKPAARHTLSGHVTVLATRGTLASGKYAALRLRVSATAPQLRFTEIACDGLAAAIEQWALDGDGTACDELVDRYLAPVFHPAVGFPAVDTVVLGCTHYPLIGEQIRLRVPTTVALLDAGAPVARQTWRLLNQASLLRPPSHDGPALDRPGQVRLLATGDTARLQAAARRWLDLPPGDERVERVELASA
jgi:glutamate racemase